LGNRAAGFAWTIQIEPHSTKWLEEVLNTPNVRLAELPPRVLLESSLLPGSPPRDPADRIIAATAREFGFTVVTRDRVLLEYAREGYLRAIAVLNSGAV
jgi:PIN domain nuclease of toxin-antitoxin system